MAAHDDTQQPADGRGRGTVGRLLAGYSGGRIPKVGYDEEVVAETRARIETRRHREAYTEAQHHVCELAVRATPAAVAAVGREPTDTELSVMLTASLVDETLRANGIDPVSARHEELGRARERLRREGLLDALQWFADT